MMQLRTGSMTFISVKISLTMQFIYPEETNWRICVLQQGQWPTYHCNKIIHITSGTLQIYLTRQLINRQKPVEISQECSQVSQSQLTWLETQYLTKW
jgi:hypothetical protein